MAEQPTSPVYLSALSPKDQRWDTRRAEADGFKALYRETDYNCYSLRIAGCSCQLDFAFQTDDITGLCTLKLQAAKFCRVRLCPVCQDRRSMMWRGKAFKILPKVLESHPSARFIFLTLTVRNCQLVELRSTLTWMHESWRKLLQRKDWPAQGWIRAVEVTRGHDDTAHPHYHCLLMVHEGYFKRGYLSHDRWTQIWKECLGVDYIPIVDVRAVRPKKGTSKAEEGAATMAALVETLKYSVKPSDVLRGDKCDQLSVMTDQEWLIELTTQLHKTRAIATGGILKDYLKVLENEPNDLIHVDENGLVEADHDSPRITFGWRERAKRYRLDETAS